MKSLKSLFIISTLFVLAACSGSNSASWTRLSETEIDQKSYAIAYGATAQTYADRVNGSYDIDAFVRGVDDWFNQKVSLPIEQIRASLLNRMLDHNVYAYYSGVLHAADFQSKFNYLSPTCWGFVQPPSLTQGIYDALVDIQKNQVRNDKYIQDGADQVLHLCVEQVESDQQKQKAKKGR